MPGLGNGVDAVGADNRLDGGIKTLSNGEAFYGLLGITHAECHRCGCNQLQQNGCEKGEVVNRQKIGLKLGHRNEHEALIILTDFHLKISNAAG